MIQGGAMFGDDLVYLEAGIGQCLPKDQFGRAVVMLRRGDQELAGLQRGVHNVRSIPTVVACVTERIYLTCA